MTARLKVAKLTARLKAAKLTARLKVAKLTARLKVAKMTAGQDSKAEICYDDCRSEILTVVELKDLDADEVFVL